MTKLTLELPEGFSEALQTLARQAYQEAIDQARRDAGITRDFLALDEVTESFLAISRGTLEKWIKKGLPAYKIEGKVYIRKAELYAYIEAHKV